MAPLPGPVSWCWLLAAALCLPRGLFLSPWSPFSRSLLQNSLSTLHNDDTPLGKWKLQATSSPEGHFHHVLSVCQNAVCGQSRLRGREISPTSRIEIVVGRLWKLPIMGRHLKMASCSHRHVSPYSFPLPNSRFA